MWHAHGLGVERVDGCASLARGRRHVGFWVNRDDIGVEATVVLIALLVMIVAMPETGPTMPNKNGRPFASG
jgi:hypothetical protein